MKRLITAAVVAILWGTQAHAQSDPQPASEAVLQHKVAVYIDFTGEDEVGRAIVYSLREEIRKSAGYRLADTRDDAGVSVNILSLAIDEGENNQSAVGVSMAALPSSHNRFMGSEVRIVGRKTTDNIARSIAMTIDQLVVNLRKRFVENQDTR